MKIQLMEGHHATFAVEFARALDRRGLNLTQLRQRLDARGHRVSMAALSYWRSGQREPEHSASLEALAEIEAILNVDPGGLASALSIRRRGSTLAAFDHLFGSVPNGQLYSEPEVRRHIFHLFVDVDEHHAPATVRVVRSYSALQDGVTGVSTFAGPSDGDQTQSDDLGIRAIAGCRIGETRDHDGIISQRLEFERPLRLGEGVMTEVLYEAAYLGNDMGLVAEERLEEAILWVRFNPNALPKKTWVSLREGAIDHEVEMDLDGTYGIHERHTHFGPGTIKIRWEW